MGKESVGPKRRYEIVASLGSHANKQYIQWVLAQQWSSPAVFPSTKDVSEDGYATVVVRGCGSQFTTVCKGLKRSGNTYGQLVKKLVEKGVLSKDKYKICFFIRNGIIWEPADEINGEFESGSCVMAMVDPKMKKAIAKTK
eukprot:TRINITY_DN5266_c0_g1_i4.p3 TRINITY_DN5266_c0_g1~~TRINITY_DN5266_c0_g1_i4.p3  ORF type:complete len:141 (+),score=29.21 TRINITY_DN5266_c0_g1_i4:1013-1435(+)